MATALYELRRALGVVDGLFSVQGSLEKPIQACDVNTLTQTALDQRAEIHARQAALVEANARLRLEIANRFGNPNVGPAYEYDPARVNLIGAQFTLPLPLFNTRKGEILQREAEQTRAALELRQTETQVGQDVQAALARLQTARAWQSTYQNELLPRAQSSLRDIERLREKGKVDVVKIIEARRKLLKPREAYLDALLEVDQAVADLAAAVGDPSLAIAPCLASPGDKAVVAPKP